jgi:hypothetical protein
MRHINAKAYRVVIPAHVQAQIVALPREQRAVARRLLNAAAARCGESPARWAEPWTVTEHSEGLRIDYECDPETNTVIALFVVGVP